MGGLILREVRGSIYEPLSNWGCMNHRQRRIAKSRYASQPCKHTAILAEGDGFLPMIRLASATFEARITEPDQLHSDERRHLPESLAIT